MTATAKPPMPRKKVPTTAGVAKNISWKHCKGCDSTSLHGRSTDSPGLRNMMTDGCCGCVLAKIILDIDNVFAP